MKHFLLKNVKIRRMLAVFCALAAAGAGIGGDAAEPVGAAVLFNTGDGEKSGNASENGQSWTESFRSVIDAADSGAEKEKSESRDLFFLPGNEAQEQEESGDTENVSDSDTASDQKEMNIYIETAENGRNRIVVENPDVDGETPAAVWFETAIADAADQDQDTAEDSGNSSGQGAAAEDTGNSSGQEATEGSRNSSGQGAAAEDTGNSSGQRAAETESTGTEQTEETDEQPGIRRVRATAEEKSGSVVFSAEIRADKHISEGTYVTDIYAEYAGGNGETERVRIGHEQYTMKAVLKNETPVPEVLQNPELPTGCESVALTIDLMSLGFSPEKTTIADEYLPYGSNFAISYAGNPRTSSGAGCFPPCIVKTANRYLMAQDSTLRATDVSGMDLEAYFDFIDEGIPVILWHTMYMAQPVFTGSTASWGGETYRWYRSEHCLVLYGYDLERNVVKISDPLAGKVERDIDAFAQIFDAAGQYAVVIR